jgi:Na+/citrate or Na+/malate symporter
MNHLGLYFACVLLTLLAFSVGLVLVARATKWKPKPIKLVWAGLIVFAAVFVAGSVCSIVGRDIRILYWWLLGAPLVAVFIPLVVVATNLFMRLIMGALFSASGRFQRRRSR